MRHGGGSTSGGSGANGGYPQVRSGYDELDTTLMPPRPGEQQLQPQQQQQPHFHRGASQASDIMASQGGPPPGQPHPGTFVPQGTQLIYLSPYLVFFFLKFFRRLVDSVNSSLLRTSPEF